jgi:hypothetical protein
LPVLFLYFLLLLAVITTPRASLAVSSKWTIVGSSLLSVTSTAEGLSVISPSIHVVVVTATALTELSPVAITITATLTALRTRVGGLSFECATLELTAIDLLNKGIGLCFIHLDESIS